MDSCLSPEGRGLNNQLSIVNCQLSIDNLTKRQTYRFVLADKLEVV